MVKEFADGILNFDKPSGITSMDVVRTVKRLTHVRRVGHAGTLDPIATGVLPVCMGQATRLMEYMIDGRKAYRAELTLGAVTDTYDADGQIVATGDASEITRAQVEALLPVFTGTLQQQPPMYSALKHEGKRLYDLARAGIEVERPDREVIVYDLTLTDWAPPKVTVVAECGRGFYMRTLAHDMGQALGCGAHLSALTRLRAGTMSIEGGVSLERFEHTIAEGEWRDLLLPPDAAVADMEALALEPSGERQLRNGQPITIRPGGGATYAEHAERRRAYSSSGRFLAVVRFNRAQNQWQPERVFDLTSPSLLAPGAD